MKIIRPRDDAGCLVLMADDFLNQEDYRESVADAVFLLLKTNHKMVVRTELNAESQVIIDYTYNDDGYDAVIIREDDEDDN